MEAELLRSKTELMMLNNQLLEAAQKRLELSLELEAWKVTETTAGPQKRCRSLRYPEVKWTHAPQPEMLM